MTGKQIARIQPKQESLSDDPWDGDDFDRKSVGQMFQNLLLNTPSPTTIALKADWGTGKTTFLRRVQKSIAEDAAVVFIDLWRADSAVDPLAVIAEELAKAIEEQRGYFNRFSENAKKLGTSIADNATSIFASATAVGMFFEPVALAAGSTLKAATAAVSWLSDLNKKKRKAIDALHTNLKALGKAVQEDGKPIIIILDEFDRCRPDFAVQTLERIKHYFDTAGYTFVLAIDDSAVASAVSGHYGGKLDGEKYLRRFFDYEFRLPPPTKQHIALFAASRLLNQEGNAKDLTSIWRNDLLRLLSVQSNVSPDLTIISLSAILSEAMALSVRDQLQATTLTFTLFRSKHAKQFMDPASLSFLCFARFGNLNQFRLFESGDLNFEQLVNAFRGLERVSGSVFRYFVEFGIALQMSLVGKEARMNEFSSQGRTAVDDFRRVGCSNSMYYGYGEQCLRDNFFALNRII